MGIFVKQKNHPDTEIEIQQIQTELSESNGIQSQIGELQNRRNALQARIATLEQAIQELDRDEAQNPCRATDSQSIFR